MSGENTTFITHETRIREAEFIIYFAHNIFPYAETREKARLLLEQLL